MSDINNPPIVPTDSEYQKPAVRPSMRKGIKPSTVERMVERMGMSL